MFFLFLLLVLGTLLFFLVRNGQLGSTAWAPSRSPEAEAKRTLPSGLRAATSRATNSWSAPVS